MNKQEFKSAYNKITLSEEFKAAARAKLTEQFGKTAEKYPSDNIIEEHPAAAITLSPNNERKKSPWKTVIGIGSAAAVIGLGIWGGSVWLDRTQNPLDGQQTTEVAESVENNESTETAEVIDTVTAEFVEHRVTFPAYYDYLDGNNMAISNIVPFELDISLPEGWEIVTPEWSEHIGFSMVYIMSDGEYVGSIDINKYEKYEGIEYGEPNYHQMVFNQLMLGSTVNWGFDYTEIKTDGWMKSATCSVYHNPANGYADDVGYTSGILAYDDDMQVYVNIYFNRVLDEKLHTEIAESISITESTMGLADRLATLMIEQESGLQYNAETDLGIYAVNIPCGTYISVAYPTEDGSTNVSVYEIRNSRINGILPFYPAVIYSFEDSFIYKKGSILPNGRHKESYIRYNPDDITHEIIAEFEYSLPPDDEWPMAYDIICYMDNKEISLTNDEMIDLEIEITEGFISINTLNDSFNHKHTQCNVESLATIIRQTLYVMPKQPVEEPAPMPPNIFLDAAGAERPLLMGSYTWGEGADEFHHDGYTVADIMSPEIGYVYPASWFEEARLVIPDGGVITSVTLHKDVQNYTELEFTADGAIILPDDPIGEHIQITVEYPQGACSYLMSVDFPETAEPPAVTLNGVELTIGSYIWNGELSGDHPRNKDIYQMFLDGELLTVTDTYTVEVTLPEGARLIEAVCLGSDLETQMQLSSTEGGMVYLPTANAKSEGIVRLSMEYPDGSVSYWLGFRHESERIIPETLTATADDVEFTLNEGTGDWGDETLFRLENNAHHIELAIPDGSAVTDARAINAEAEERDLMWTEEGIVLMPYYDTQLIRVTVTFSQGEGVYWFIYKTESAPVLTAFANDSYKRFEPFCGYWGWDYLVWEADEEGFGYQQALEMYRNGGQLPFLLDAEYFELSLPAYTHSVSVTYYDENGVSKELYPDDNGIYYMPDEMLVMIKVNIISYGGICEYWFAHVIGVCGTQSEEADDYFNGE